MKNMTMLLAAAFLGLAGTARAELAPDVYLDAARRAPEALRVRVLDVAQRNEGASTIFDVVGEVVEVRRSAAGLEPGSRVRIVYGNTRHPPGWVGPAQVPGLRKGDVVPAFVEPNGSEQGVYRPAARGQSFSGWVWEQSADETGPLYVVYKADNNSCGAALEGEPGASRLKWMENYHLRVSIWAFVPMHLRVLDEGGSAVVDGNELKLSYRTRVDETGDGPAPACLHPISLQYDIWGLPRRDYRVTFHESKVP